MDTKNSYIFKFSKHEPLVLMIVFLLPVLLVSPTSALFEYAVINCGGIPNWDIDWWFPCNYFYLTNFS